MIAAGLGLRCAGTLIGALLLSLALTLPAPDRQIAEAGSDELWVAIAERGWFGLPNDADHVSALLDRDLPRLDGWPGLVLTEEEASELDMAARMRFVADVDRELSDYLSSEPLVGGAWFDQAMGGRFVVSLIADDSRVKETIRRLMPSESLGLQFRDARYSLAVLSDAVRRLDAVWASITRSPPPVSIGVNERENAVSVGVAENDWSSLTQATAAELEKELGVPVVYHAEMDGADLSCANRDSCPGFQAGLMVRYHSPSSSKYCSSGFLIHKGSATPPYQFLTSGHCARNVSGSTNTWEPFDDWWHGGSHIGDFKSHDLYVPYGIDVGRIGIDGGLSVIVERIFSTCATSLIAEVDAYPSGSWIMSSSRAAPWTPALPTITQTIAGVTSTSPKSMRFLRSGHRGPSGLGSDVRARSLGRSAGSV